MSVHVRVCRENEFRRFLETCEAAFGYDVPADDVERFRRVISPERTHAAFDGDTMVGTAGSFPFTLTVPGGELAAGGVTMVGVLPSHRRRGVLTNMMRAQLEDAHSKSEPVAILWASEGAIYQRFGYGLATRQAAIDIESDRALFLDRSPGRGRCRLLTNEEALKVLPDVYERVRARTPGMFARSQSWWEVCTLDDRESERRGGGPMWRVAWEIDGRAEAYALYRYHSEWTDSIPSGWLEVMEAMATSPLATRELWAYLFGVDLISRVKAWALPIDHPLFLMLAEPRRLRLMAKDALWLRVVDVRAALEGRSFARDATLTFELTDELCPWNQGTWRLEATRTGARIAPSDGPADLRLGAPELGSAFLGGTTFCELAAAGRIQELREDAALDATMAFLVPIAPWCAEVF
jgi:predicted acetyltransferase